MGGSDGGGGHEGRADVGDRESGSSMVEMQTYRINDSERELVRVVSWLDEDDVTRNGSSHSIVSFTVRVLYELTRLFLRRETEHGINEFEAGASGIP